MSKAGGEGEGRRYAALVFDADVLEARLPRALPAPRPGAASIVAISELRQRIGIAIKDAIGMRNGLAVFVLAIDRLDAVIETYGRSEEHTSELQSLMRISYAVFCLKKKQQHPIITTKE